MKTQLIIILSLLACTSWACECLEGNEIIMKYFFKVDYGNEDVTIKIKEQEELFEYTYRTVYWVFDNPKEDSLIGYMRMDSSCLKMYYFNASEKREDLIYNMDDMEYRDFRVRMQDGLNREFFMYHSVKSIKTINERRIIEFNDIKLAWKETGNLKFIEGIGPNCLFFLEPNEMNTTFLGFNGILVSKIVDGITKYSINKRLLARHSLRSFVIDYEYMTSSEMANYGDLIDLEDEVVLNSITSSKDIYLILENMNWDGELALVSKLVDHPMCDKGAAMLAFWYNVPNYYIEKGYKIKQWDVDGHQLNLKLFTRLYTNYYKNEENYFVPQNMKYGDYEDIMKIPLEFKLPVKGTRYIIRD